jgi:ABC-type nitrate/sulfonate/bicarbonate transport system substrate-binding protein
MRIVDAEYRMAAVRTKISILYPVIGAKQVSLWIAYDQGLFAKQELEVAMIESRLNRGLPGRDDIRGNLFAAIGIPPTISQVAHGADLKVVAAYNNATGTTLQLVGNNKLKKSDDLRGHRFGVNRVGTGPWIAAMLVLQHLGLDPGRDHISVVETTGGALGQMRALENGEIDATVLDPSLSAQLVAKGFNLIMDLSSIDMPSIQDGMMVESSYLRANPDIVEKVVVGLAEGIVFSQSPRNKEIVVKTLMKWLNISDPRVAELAYQESLTRANRDLEASPSAAKSYQDVLALVDPQVLKVDIQDLFEHRFARKMKENGELDRLYANYGVR